MKKYLNIAFSYAIAAMAGGVFYREFTKYNGFSSVTTLSKVHAHLFMLGMIMFLVVALFAYHNNKLIKSKSFKAFLWVYNIGVIITAAMLLARGITQVLGTALTSGASAAVSGVAGIGHIFTGVGIILLFVSLKKTAKS
ncbi:MAG: DUF2871 domain-containing protein [Acutalibacteraceae bacterium]